MQLSCGFECLMFAIPSSHIVFQSLNFTGSNINSGFYFLALGGRIIGMEKKMGWGECDVK